MEQPSRQAVRYDYKRTRHVAKISRLMTSVGMSCGLIQVLVHALLAYSRSQDWSVLLCVTAIKQSPHTRHRDLHYVSRLAIIIPCHVGMITTQLWAFFRIHHNP